MAASRARLEMLRKNKCSELLIAVTQEFKLRQDLKVLMVVVIEERAKEELSSWRLIKKMLIANYSRPEIGSLVVRHTSQEEPGPSCLQQNAIPTRKKDGLRNRLVKQLASPIILFNEIFI